MKHLMLGKSDDKTFTVTSSERDYRPLVALLYLLMRDHLSTGTLDKLVSEVEDVDFVDFANLELAKYAKELADRLQPKPDELVQEDEGHFQENRGNFFVINPFTHPNVTINSFKDDQVMTGFVNLSAAEKFAAGRYKIFRAEATQISGFSAEGACSVIKVEPFK